MLLIYLNVAIVRSICGYSRKNLLIEVKLFVEEICNSIPQAFYETNSDGGKYCVG